MSGAPGHLCWRNLAHGGSRLERSRLSDPLCLSSPEFQTATLASCLADTQQTLTRCARVAMALESSTVIIFGCQSWSRKIRTQERSRSGADGVCQRGTNSPGKSHVSQAARQHPGAAILPSVLAPIHPWGQEPMGRAHFAQKEAKSRGEG